MRKTWGVLVRAGLRQRGERLFAGAAEEEISGMAKAPQHAWRPPIDAGAPLKSRRRKPAGRRDCLFARRDPERHKRRTGRRRYQYRRYLIGTRSASEFWEVPPHSQSSPAPAPRYPAHHRTKR
jgi:hypothetical protein